MSLCFTSFRPRKWRNTDESSWLFGGTTESQCAGRGSLLCLHLRDYLWLGFCLRQVKFWSVLLRKNNTKNPSVVLRFRTWSLPFICDLWASLAVISAGLVLAALRTRTCFLSQRLIWRCHEDSKKVMSLRLKISQEQEAAVTCLMWLFWAQLVMTGLILECLALKFKWV